MKQGWEIKKLGEVVKKLFAGGDKPKLFAEYQTEQLSIPVYANGISLDGLVGYTDKAIVEEESITISARGTIGFCCVRKSPFVPIVRLITLIPSEDINTEYLCYVLRNTKFDNNGVAIPQLTIPMIREMLIPIPPREEQERIVAELDCLSGVIEKKREQLRELDALVQSIFYQMFGDPITNEKGWEVKKMGEEFEVSSGGTPDTKNPSYWDNGDISWIGSNMCQNEIIYQNDGKYITVDGLSHSSAKEYHNGYVLVALVGATIGKVALLKFMTTTNQNIAGINVPANKEYTSEYVFYLVQNLYNLFMEVGGDKFKMANLSFVRSLPIPKPSYTLQQQFADKIEAIEKQKELIKQSITQTETLFNARMDYYFN